MQSPHKSNENNLDVDADNVQCVHMVNEEAQEERDWIAEQRATLDGIRGLVTPQPTGEVSS